MTTSKTTIPPKKTITSIKEDRQARSFSDLDEKSRFIQEKIRQSRVQYIVKDLPIY
ncbi:MAG: hypothetical protein ABI415_05585 [Flavitalea sp.]